MVNVANTVVEFLVGAVGVPLMGAEVLDVRGRRSGVARSVVVNPFEVDGDMYLMSARGESQWVKNLRAEGKGRLRRGRKSRAFVAHELPDEEKLPLMRAYLRRWDWQVKSFMGVDKGSSDDDLRAILPSHPLFRIEIHD